MAHQFARDVAAAPVLFAQLDGQPISKVVRMYADSKYHNFNLYELVDEHAKRDLEIVRRPEGMLGWVNLPIRRSPRKALASMPDEPSRANARQSEPTNVGQTEALGLISRLYVRQLAPDLPEGVGIPEAVIWATPHTERVERAGRFIVLRGGPRVCRARSWRSPA
jgi:hypothetical protein